MVRRDRPGPALPRKRRPEITVAAPAEAAAIRPGLDDIAEIMVSRRSGPVVTVDDSTRTTAQALNRKLSEEPLEVVGRLHMGDFAPDHLRCRVDTAGGSVTCQFEEAMKQAVLGAMDRMVVAGGVAEYWPGDLEPRLLHLRSVRVVDEAGASVEELVRLQGVGPVGKVEDVRGEPSMTSMSSSP